MFKKWLCAAVVAACAAFGGAAHAADVAPAASYDWSGFYLGANVGYGWGSTQYDFNDGLLNGAPAIPAPSRAVGIDYDGVAGGGQIGYNWQVDGLVLGLEADVQASGASGDTHTNDTPPCYVEGCSAEVNWFGTGRARVGYAIDSFMPYVTAGAALGGIKGDADLGACGYTGSCNYDDTAWGWTVGGGVEWGFAEHWSAKAEYLYVNFVSPDFSGPGGKGVSADNLDLNVVRIGINYRIN